VSHPSSLLPLHECPMIEGSRTRTCINAGRPSSYGVLGPSERYVPAFLLSCLLFAQPFPSLRRQSAQLHDRSIMQARQEGEPMTAATNHLNCVGHSLWILGALARSTIQGLTKHGGWLDFASRYEHGRKKNTSRQGSRLAS
jgi:hypothetical protein